MCLVTDTYVLRSPYYTSIFPNIDSFQPSSLGIDEKDGRPIVAPVYVILP